MTHQMLQFVDSTTDLSAAIDGAFDPFLVMLSFAIASVAGYAALLIAERLRAAEGQRIGRVWLATGACAMGSGIWAMHFVGMLAFTLPIAVNYDRTLTILSILPAILASGSALQFMRASRLGFGRLNFAALLMAAGIGTMHFMGMAGMITNAEMRYDPVLFVASIAVAHVLAALALYAKQVLGRITSRIAAQVTAAGTIGLAVGGMHYTAMASAFYFPGRGAMVPEGALSDTTLALAVIMVVGFILGTTIVTAVVDQRLQEAHYRVKLILDSAGEGIYGVDSAGRITFVNPAAAEMLGWDSEQLVGQSVHDAIHHSRADGSAGSESETPAQWALEDGVVRHVRDEVFWRPDGTTFPVEYISTPMRAPDEQTGGVVVTFRDLTEQRALEAQLVQAQKLESIGHLASGIAHEINTPAQYVGDNLEFLAQGFEGLAELLKHYDLLHVAAKDGVVPPALISDVDQAIDTADIEFIKDEIPRALSQSREGIQRVTEIVAAMKDFSHPGSVQMKPTDLNDAISSTVIVARNAWRYVAELETDFDANLPPVFCLAGEINQMMLNLIVNAAQAVAEKASGEMGRIRIRTQRDGERWVLIEISDTGTGIPKKIHNKIFDPFFTTKEVGQGTGQGLAIAHSIVVDKHHGSIEVESEIGCGTTFRIRLPLSGEMNDLIETSR